MSHLPFKMKKNIGVNSKIREKETDNKKLQE